MENLLIATNNKGKIKEISDLLSPFNINIKQTSDFNLEEPVEDGATFAENALIKAKHYFKNTKLPSLADDSGLIIDALDGRPGIYSARWAGADKNFTVAFKKIEKLLNEKNIDPYNENVPASFFCCLSFINQKGEDFSFSGEVKGTIKLPAKGDNGFGYDPIFIPTGYDQTFAEMPGNIKKNLSHRSRAFEKFASYLTKNLHRY